MNSGLFFHFEKKSRFLMEKFFGGQQDSRIKLPLPKDHLNTKVYSFKCPSCWKYNRVDISVYIIYSGRKFGKYPYNTRPMESTPLLQPKSGI